MNWKTHVQTQQQPIPKYLAPYVSAAERHGAGFGALLWASPRTQATRFQAIAELYDMNGKSILDVGCGRADFLDFLISRGIEPHDYAGLEAVDELADAAEAKRLPRCRIIRADFVKEPARLFVGADVLVFSGSLNTLGVAEFYASVRRAYEACADAVAFNFLSSPELAGRDFLSWHRVGDVLTFVRALGVRNADAREGYLSGDCTILLGKQH